MAVRHCIPSAEHARVQRCLAETTSSRLNRFRRRKDPHCGLNPWLHVSRDHRVIGRYPRKCIWLHPVAGARTRLTWRPKVWGRSLDLHFGFADKAVMHFKGKSPRTKPLTLRSKVVANPLKRWLCSQHRAGKAIESFTVYGSDIDFVRADEGNGRRAFLPRC